MSKRVPPFSSFTTDDGNPDDKRPRRGDIVPENLNIPSSFSTSRQNFSPNEFPSGSSTTSVLSSHNQLPSLASNGILATNGSNGHHHSNGIMSMQNMGHSNNLSDVFSNGGDGFPSSKCSICLWPIGSPRCYHHHSHHLPHQLSTR